jgi:hypothetical protein
MREVACERGAHTEGPLALGETNVDAFSSRDRDSHMALLVHSGVRIQSLKRWIG